MYVIGCTPSVIVNAQKIDEGPLTPHDAGLTS